MTDQDIENEIKDAGADVAPRVTLAGIEAAIDDERYFTAGQGIIGEATLRHTVQDEYHHSLNRLTFCILVLCNGYTIVGKSACVSAANFNAEIGRKVAREDAINQAWPLFGFALAEDLYRINQPDV